MAAHRKNPLFFRVFILDAITIFVPNRECDICGHKLHENSVAGGYLDGYRILNRFFNKLDICSNCMKKNKLLSIDIKEEKKCIDKIFDDDSEYSEIDDNYKTAYLHGAKKCIRCFK